MPDLKIPPHYEDIEKAILGGILIDKDAINVVAPLISPFDFYDQTHQIIYEQMVLLNESQKPIDIVTLSTQVKKSKPSAKITASTLSDLVNNVATSANIEHYAKMVKDASTKRRLIKAGGIISELGFSEEDVKHVLDRAESEVFSISQGHTVKGFTKIKEALQVSYDNIMDLHNKGQEMRGVKTGFFDLDNTLSGMQDANLIILAARPGQGKTAMAINIAQHVGVAQKIPVGIFSLEMSQEELVDRLLVGQSDIDAWKLKTRKLTEIDLEKITDAMGDLSESSIFIDDTPGISISEIRTKARRLQLEHGLRFLIVDYLQLVDPGKRYESRVQEVSVVSQALKNLARELKIPVLALSQLSRAVEHRGEKKPQLADLRESGAIEQDADVVMFLYRPEDEVSQSMLTKLLIAKHRNGPTGEIDLLFRGDRIRFYSMDKKREEVI